MQYSSLANKLDGQPMFKLLSLSKDLEKDGKKIIHFEIGDPSFAQASANHLARYHFPLAPIWLYQNASCSHYANKWS